MVWLGSMADLMPPLTRQSMSHFCCDLQQQERRFTALEEKLLV